MKRILGTWVLLLFVNLAFAQRQYLQFVYVSDSHYGLERTFRGKPGVSSSKVNRALIAAINRLPAAVLPADNGIKGGEEIGSIDYVINTGDIANRAERGIQRSRKSWRQFAKDWRMLSVKNAAGGRSRLLLLPGNHDISNAVGHPMIASRKVDASSAAAIYTDMTAPVVPVTGKNYGRNRHVANYSFDDAGVHFSFIDMWPDSRNRRWLADDLKLLPDSAVCLLFTHDQPDIEAKHLVNPNGTHAINATDRFENLTGDTSSVRSVDEIPVREHRQWAAFVKAHPVLKGYFHGNENYQEFYTWRGPEGDIALPVFRVDSPMKGIESSKDEARLSFQFVVLDLKKKQMTVRECLWNKSGVISWGERVTVPL